MSRIPRRMVGGALVAAAMALPAGTALAGTAFAGTFDASRYVHVQPVFPRNPGGPIELNPQPLPPLDWAQLNPQPIPAGRPPPGGAARTHRYSSARPHAWPGRGVYLL